MKYARTTLPTLILALSLSAAAQAPTDIVQQVPSPDAVITGLPQFGVTVTGPAEKPILTNHTTKAIVAALLKVTQENGKVRLLHGAYIPPQSSIDPGVPTEFASLLGRSMIPGTTGFPIATEELLAVVFADGEMVGQDGGGFQAETQQRFKDLVNLGNLINSGSWAAIQALTPADPAAGPKYFLGLHAARVLEMRKNMGDDVVRTLAAQYLQLPTNIVKH